MRQTTLNPVWTVPYYGVTHCHKSNAEWGSATNYNSFATAFLKGIHGFTPTRNFEDIAAAKAWIEQNLFGDKKA